MKNKTNFVNVRKYAELCGVTTTTINYRIYAGEILCVENNGDYPQFYGKLIDINRFPPVGRKKNGRKSYKELEKMAQKVA